MDTTHSHSAPKLWPYRFSVQSSSSCGQTIKSPNSLRKGETHTYRASRKCYWLCKHPFPYQYESLKVLLWQNKIIVLRLILSLNKDVIKCDKEIHLLGNYSPASYGWSSGTYQHFVVLSLTCSCKRSCGRPELRAPTLTLVVRKCFYYRVKGGVSLHKSQSRHKTSGVLTKSYKEGPGWCSWPQRPWTLCKTGPASCVPPLLCFSSGHSSLLSLAQSLAHSAHYNLVD